MFQTTALQNLMSYIKVYVEPLYISECVFWSIVSFFCGTEVNVWFNGILYEKVYCKLTLSYKFFTTFENDIH